MYDETLATELMEAGCNVRPYQPDPRVDPTRMAWEVVLPIPDVVVEPEVLIERREHRDD